MGSKLFLYGLAMVLAVVAGRFINFVVYKSKNDLGLFKKKDFCPICNGSREQGSFVAFYEYLVFGKIGKCCKDFVSSRNIWVEVFAGIVVVISFGAWGFGAKGYYSAVLAIILICISLIDYDIMEIPDFLIIGVALMGVVGIFVFRDISLISRLIGMVIISVPMYLLNKLIEEAFGEADVLLIGSCGIVLGWSNTLLAMFIALVMGGLYAVFLIFSKKIGKGEHISFGQYICVGTFVALLYGDRLINMYLSYFKFL